MITVARFSLPYEAQLARAKLESEGVPAFVADEHTINMQWLFSNALGGVRVQVPNSYGHVAVGILSKDHSEALVREQGMSHRLALNAVQPTLSRIPRVRRWHLWCSCSLTSRFGLSSGRLSALNAM